MFVCFLSCLEKEVVVFIVLEKRKDCVCKVFNPFHLYSGKTFFRFTVLNWVFLAHCNGLFIFLLFLLTF